MSPGPWGAGETSSASLAAVSAMAATPVGTLEGADSSSIYGWVWDSDSYGHVNNRFVDYNYITNMLKVKEIVAKWGKFGKNVRISREKWLLKGEENDYETFHF